MVEKRLGGKTVRLVRGDITLAEADAFVHDITGDCKLGSGYGGAIASRGGKAVQDELESIGALPTGEAVLTRAGNLKAKHIIHVNGPKFHEPDTERKLTRATEAALRLAEEHQIETLAFPPIGTGLYQVPLDLCARVMLSCIERHLAKADSRLRVVLLVANDSRELAPLAAALDKLAPAPAVGTPTPAAGAAQGERIRS